MSLKIVNIAPSAYNCSEKDAFMLKNTTHVLSIHRMPFTELERARINPCSSLGCASGCGTSMSV